MTTKTSRGRTTTGGVKVPDVETRPCPARPGSHWLINRLIGRRLTTVCRGCGCSWADLDAEIRAEVGWVGRTA